VALVIFYCGNDVTKVEIRGEPDLPAGLGAARPLTGTYGMMD
jgi:hypothetical protein